MKRFAVLMALAALASGRAAELRNSPPTRESAATLVIYNNLDDSSVALAAYYAKRRSIPIDHTVGLNCPITEEITREQYDQTIAEPLRRIFSERHWWHVPGDPRLPVSDNQVRFIALMRGIPLKIAAAPNYPGDSYTGKVPELNTNAAAVDSELATLGVRTRKISGPLKNLYYRSFSNFMDTPLAPIILVCRLDGPTMEIVESMIDGAIAAERGGLNGFAYIDMRGITTGPMAIGDQWLASAAASLREYGMPVITDDSPDLFPAEYPMNHAAIYLGWYAASIAPPMARDDFRFVTGAIAVHIHSFSGSTLRDPKANWCAPLLVHGAAATIGNVYEPYLGLTPNLDILADRLRNGYTFAESAYACEPVLSWMTTFVGDPLYRPFQNVDEAAESGERPAIEYAAYRKGARAWSEQGRAAGEKALQDSARDMRSGIVWEGLGLLQQTVPDNDAALDSFRRAEICYGPCEDGLRAVIEQATILKAQNKMDEARKLAADELGTYSDFQGASLLRAIIGLPSAEGAR